MTQQGAGTPQVCPLPAVHILQLGVCAAIFLSTHPTHQVSPSALGTCCAPHTSQYFKLPALYIPYQPRAQTPRATRPHMHGLCRLSHDNLQTGRPLRREPRRAPLVRAKVAAPVPPVLSPIDATITISRSSTTRQQLMLSHILTGSPKARAQFSLRVSTKPRNASSSRRTPQRMRGHRRTTARAYWSR